MNRFYDSRRWSNKWQTIYERKESGKKRSKASFFFKVKIVRFPPPPLPFLSLRKLLSTRPPSASTSRRLRKSFILTLPPFHHHHLSSAISDKREKSSHSDTLSSAFITAPATRPLKVARRRRTKRQKYKKKKRKKRWDSLGRPARPPGLYRVNTFWMTKSFCFILNRRSRTPLPECKYCITRELHKSD